MTALTRLGLREPSWTFNSLPEHTKEYEFFSSTLILNCLISPFHVAGSVQKESMLLKYLFWVSLCLCKSLFSARNTFQSVATFSRLLHQIFLIYQWLWTIYLRIAIFSWLVSIGQILKDLFLSSMMRNLLFWLQICTYFAFIWVTKKITMLWICCFKYRISFPLLLLSVTHSFLSAHH